ncbi:MAG: hypothetical protein JJT96_10985, partial [Opitutales bacterium]|nr:hypothetical protein [Opitutales bacterium]
ASGRPLKTGRLHGSPYPAEGKVVRRIHRRTETERHPRTSAAQRDEAGAQKSARPPPPRVDR